MEDKSKQGNAILFHPRRAAEDESLPMDSCDEVAISITIVPGPAPSPENPSGHTGYPAFNETLQP